MLNANDAGFNFNNLETFGTYAITNSENWDNKPSEANGSGFVICGGWIYDGNRRTLQVLYLQDNTAYFRAYNPVSSSWQSWQKFSFDIPTFYKDYADLSALASALGATTITLDASVLESLEASYQAVGNYALFSGSTAEGAEGGWYGFKRADDRMSFALISYSDLGFFVAKRHPVSGWSFTRLIQ